MRPPTFTTTDAPAHIEGVDVAAYRIPTDGPEADGTLEWNATTLVVAHVHAQGCTGMGYGYADAATAYLCRDTLAGALRDADAWHTGECMSVMRRALRNIGTQGVGAMAMSVLDVALWDWKARALGQPLSRLLGRCHAAVPVYGSGGFTNYADERLQEQLAAWADQGLRHVKMKVGRDAQRDRERVRHAREAIGPEVGLMVDANGAHDVKVALQQAEHFAQHHVEWFEEPVSSDDLEGLALLRQRAPACMAIAAGEYGYEPRYFRQMLAAQAVDVLQADATRCGGVTGFLQAAALCEAHGRPLSAHCAPALHATLLCCAPTARHIEYFHDHVRMEQWLFEGCTTPVDGQLSPNMQLPGLGLTFRPEEARCFKLL